MIYVVWSAGKEYEENDRMMMENYFTYYPDNMGEFQGDYHDNTKMCICGLNTGIMGIKGSYMQMYRLAQAKWDWNKAVNVRVLSKYSDGKVTGSYIADTMWYSPADSSFASYELPRALIESVVNGYFSLFAEAEITHEAQDCKAYVTYYAPNWFDILYNLPDEERKPFADSHNQENLFVYKEKKGGKEKMMMMYPEDFTGVEKSWEAKKDDRKKKVTFMEMKKMSRINAIACPYTLTSTDKLDKEKVLKGTIVFADKNVGFHLFVALNKHLEFDSSIVAAEEINKIISNQKITLTKMHVMSNEAFLWKNFIRKDGELELSLLENAEEIKNHIILPNTLEHTICIKMLNPKELGQHFEFSNSDFQAVWKKYKHNCPMVAMKGQMLYFTPDEEAPSGQKANFRLPFYKVNPELFPDEPSSELIFDGMADFQIDAKSIKFEKNDTYDADLQGAIDAELEDQKKREEFENEQANKSKPTEKTPDLETPPTYSELQKAGEDSSQTKGSEDNTEPDEDSPIKSHTNIEQTTSDVETVEKSTDEDEELINCRKRRKALEDEYAPVEKGPREIPMAVNMIKNMMFHPHSDDGCTKVLGLVRVDRPNGGMVINEAKNAMVMEWEVNIVNPLLYDPEGKDPNKMVYEIIFKNHNYENQQDALYYIPARELINEWDKYFKVLEVFIDFTTDLLGEELDLLSTYNNLLSYLEKELSEDKKFTIGDTHTGAEDLRGNSNAKYIENVFTKTDPFLLRFFRLDSGGEKGFYDFVYQSWMIGSKYIMVKINGTRFNYSVLINKYSNQTKLIEIFVGILNQLRRLYINETNDSVVSLRQVKQLVWTTMEKLCKDIGFGFIESPIPSESDEYDRKYEGHEAIINNEHLAFMYSFLAENIDEAISVRGFVHLRENLALLNLYFESELFVAEYIIPLVDTANFTMYVNDIFSECYEHMKQLVINVQLIEHGDLTEDQLDEEEKLGRYSMKKIILSVISKLKEREVYGCVHTFNMPKSEMTYTDGKPSINFEDMDDTEANKKVYKWMTPPKDITGELLILRSNHLYEDPIKSRCDEDETLNPVLLHLYPTWLNKRNGYALTINSPTIDGKKDIKTTYHFVKYQDYAHMRVFEHFINGIMNQIFDPRPDIEIEEKDEGGGD